MDDLPGPVLTFLDAIGVPWPYLNEGDIRQFAAMVRVFGQSVEQTHQDATVVLSKFAQAYQGTATQRMQSGWGQLSARHAEELVEGCRVLAEALDVGADVIVAQKVAAIAELVVLAATFEAEAGRARIAALQQQIVRHVTDEIIEAAAKPLFARIEQAMSGLDWSQTSGGGDGGAAGSDAAGFTIDHGVAAAHLELLRGHAETFRGHAETLRGGLEGLAF
ncbi:hypothetical protein [Streptacidiphilus sp. MAP5-3]|uniref:WXG100-like domain-containing protein n=1 Tax=unclassified Streptacidiphilus TaxID=2643834 RepID=UPI003514CEEF